MITIDGAVLEEWVIEHKSQSVALIVIAIIFFGCWFILYKPLINYRFVSEDIEKQEQQLVQTKKLILEREVLIQEKRMQIDQLEKRHEYNVGEKSSALWLSQHLGQCGIFQYAFTSDNFIPPGGQGRPIFNVTMSSNYEQALCALLRFSRYSVGWKLSELRLSRENNKRWLNMKLVMEIQQ